MTGDVLGELGGVVLRRPTADDAEAAARCHVACWQETYAHLLSASFLDNQDLAARTETWRRIAERAPERHVLAVDRHDVVGFAGTRTPPDDDAPRDLDLWGLYVRRSHHGTGLGQALVDAVLGDRPALVWVAEDNPRARAFYERNGFRPDGTREAVAEWEGLVEIRMVR